VAGVGDEPIIVDASGRRSFAVGETIHLSIPEDALLAL